MQAVPNSVLRQAREDPEPVREAIRQQRADETYDKTGAPEKCWCGRMWMEAWCGTHGAPNQTHRRGACHFDDSGLPIPRAEASPPIPPSEPRALTFSDLRDANRTRCEGAFHPIAAWSPNDWMTAVAGEVGEAANMLKKLHRADPDHVFDLADFGRELADVVIYLDLLAERMGVDLGAAIIGKFNEVSQRRGSSIRLGARAALAARSGEGAAVAECLMKNVGQTEHGVMCWCEDRKNAGHYSYCWAARRFVDAARADRKEPQT